MSYRKPVSQQAMLSLATQVRSGLPFHIPPKDLCQHSCKGCPKKLMEFLDTELEDVERRLELGDDFSLGEISKLARTSQKIYRVMEKNGLLKQEMQAVS
ncbi:hypothetical protein [Oceanobacter mangrovi]|uniref:hypothetical protein n=1 Tax=Oceanobacter mangrovi TaxID=2862510 RepID=UPI001C8E6EF6|nr:hypothetical protein [Oceanobacter mangrovi]